MFERFTDRARRVVVHAQEEASALNHNYIGTEHILLGLIDEGEGVAVKALESLGLSRKALRQQVKEIIGQGQPPLRGHFPFTAQAKKVVELAQDESETLGHGFVDTDHLLIGLIREGDGVAAQVLAGWAPTWAALGDRWPCCCQADPRAPSARRPGWASGSARG